MKSERKTRRSNRAKRKASKPTSRPRRSTKRTNVRKKAFSSLAFLALIFVLLIGGLGVAVAKAGASWTPKLALDLEGGTQMTLAPKVSGGGAINSDQLNQAVEIIRQRVDGAGVAEAEISTQGGKNVVVSLPGIPDQKTRALIQASAQMNFRPVIYIAPSGVGTGGVSVPVGTGKPKNASDPNWVTQQVKKQFSALDCSKQPETTKASDPAKPLVTCDAEDSQAQTGQNKTDDQQQQAKYILGPVEVPGTDLKNATNGLASNSAGGSSNTWAVNLEFNKEGTKKFQAVTQRLTSMSSPQNQFAITLDDKVLSAPVSQVAIADGKAQISGNFNQQSSQQLAEQLKYGALPISFDIQSDEQISATLGTQQLKAGLIAGLIGLFLVVIYSILQYRALAIVTVLSLTIAGALAYLFVTLFSWSEGYRLSLAGVAGLIVSIGITADSFIVFFERIRDEIRDGRSLITAVEEGWRRAIRTIVASDMVNFLAAFILFFLAVGNVRGFAFTLGITTVIDLIVVILFTFPMMRILARTELFGTGKKISGLSPKQLGAKPSAYRGRVGFVSNKERIITEENLTIAERKALKEKEEGK
ncbi:MAG: protein translocase subunit SecD [Micrococcaceae bacterium]